MHQLLEPLRQRSCVARRLCARCNQPTYSSSANEKQKVLNLDMFMHVYRWCTCMGRSSMHAFMFAILDNRQVSRRSLLHPAKINWHNYIPELFNRVCMYKHVWK
jgi:hypothetical protein